MSAATRGGGVGGRNRAKTKNLPLAGETLIHSLPALLDRHKYALVLKH